MSITTLVPTTSRPIEIIVADDPGNDRTPRREPLRSDDPATQIDVIDDPFRLLDELIVAAESHTLPDVVLLDVRGERPSGLDVLEAMKGIPSLRAIPVIVLATSPTTAQIDRARRLGARALVPHPRSAEEMEELRRSLIGLVELQHAAAGATIGPMVIDLCDVAGSAVLDLAAADERSPLPARR